MERGGCSCRDLLVSRQILSWHTLVALSSSFLATIRLVAFAPLQTSFHAVLPQHTPLIMEPSKRG